MTHNILFIESGTGWGGSASFLFSFTKYLDRKKFNPVVFFYCNGEGAFVKNIRSLGIKVFCFRKKIKGTFDKTNSIWNSIWFKKINILLKKIKLKSPLLLLSKASKFILLDIPITVKILKIIKNEKINLIFLNNDIHYHIPGILAAKLTKLPCICRKAGIGGGEKIKKLFSRFVDVYIAISNSTAQDHINNNFAYKKITTIFGGVDLEKYKLSNNRSKIREELGIPQDTKVVGIISQIDVGKGHPDFINVASLVSKEFPYAKFLIVGDDIEPGSDLRRQLQKQSNSLRLDENIIFTGWRTDIPHILSAIDIYVQPSVLPEGLCLATLEAQACNKPVVVTNAGGLAETTTDGVTGFVTPIGDWNAFASNILKLLKDEKKANEMGKKAHEYIKEKFDIKDNVKKTEQLFIELLEKK